MNKRILIVDDDKILCEELADYFQEAGFTVDYVLLPEPGIEHLFENPYDVLLLDYKMPHFDGVEFLRRSKDKVRGVKIFLISGSLAVTQILQEQGLAASVAGIFSKPFQIQALHTAINEAVNS